MSADPAPAPSVIRALLESLVETTDPEDPLYQLLVSALEEALVHAENEDKANESDGCLFVTPTTQGRIIKEMQEEWAVYYHRVIVPLLASVMTTDSNFIPSPCEILGTLSTTQENTPEYEPRYKPLTDALNGVTHRIKHNAFYRSPEYEGSGEFRKKSEELSKKGWIRQFLMEILPLISP